MKTGTTISSLLHIALIAGGLITIKPARHDVLELNNVQIDVEVTDQSNPVLGDTQAEKSEEPAPAPTKKPEVDVAALNVGDTEKDTEADPEAKIEAPVEKASTESAAPAPTPKPKPVKVEKPKPDPKPVEVAKPKEIEPPEPVNEEPKELSETGTEFAALPETTPAPVARPRPTPPKETKSDAKDDIKDLLKEKPTKETSKTKSKGKKKSKKKSDDNIKDLLNKQEKAKSGKKKSIKKASLGTKKGKKAGKLSRSEHDALRGRLGECWEVPTFIDQENLRVVLHMQLTEDGVLSKILDVKVTGVANNAHVSAIRRGLKRSLDKRNCQFTDVLPASKYETWREVRVNYDPNAF